MVKVKNEGQKETMKEAGYLLPEAKWLVRLSALISDSCVTSEELQMQDNLEYDLQNA